MILFFTYIYGIETSWVGTMTPLNIPHFFFIPPLQESPTSGGNNGKEQRVMSGGERRRGEVEEGLNLMIF